VALSDRGPALTDDVLVEVLARPQPETEPAAERICMVAAFCATTAGW
jgi:hypothetical protein